jgi:hypothetical protein
MAASRYLLLCLGALGMGLSVAAGLGVWYFESRINHAREQVYRRVDEAFIAIRGRLEEVESLAARSKITLEEVEERLRERTRDAATQRVATKFDVEGKVEQLAVSLQKTEEMLALSQETVAHVRQLLEVGDELGFGWNASSVDPLLARLAELKADLTRAGDTAESLRQRLDEDSGEKTPAGRLEQAATIVARLVVTLGQLDRRLATLEGSLTDLQRSMRDRSAQGHARLIAVAAVATLFMLWMGAGQFCLWRWARSCKSSR